MEGEGEVVVEVEVRDALGLGLAPREREEEGVRERLREREALIEADRQFEMVACVEALGLVVSEGMEEGVEAGE